MSEVASEVAQKQVKPGSALVKLVFYGLAFIAIWYGLHWWNNHQVTSDATEKYAIAQRAGDHNAACYQAGVAASSYLSAKDEDGYTKWRAIQSQACGR